jgi:peptide/nickel transport system ATP-binding protein
MIDEPLIQAAGLVKIFQAAGLEQVALQGLDLQVQRGEWVALVGPSGAGKSTLLNILAGLDRPSAGRLVVNGRDLLSASAAELTTYRATQVGMVWQQTAANLVPYLSARENVALLLSLAGQGRSAALQEADRLLASVGMAEHARRRPARLSGGQQQRVAIACALASRPAILLGDELTGELDWSTSAQILALLRELRAQRELTILLVTHDDRVAAAADRVVEIRDGRTSSEALQGERTASQQTAGEALAVLDRAGRLQLSAEQRGLAGLGRRVRVETVAGGLLIRPGEDEPSALTPAAEQSPPDAATLYAEETPTPPQRRRSFWRRGGRDG